jgi:hypothetical protein
MPEAGRGFRIKTFRNAYASVLDIFDRGRKVQFDLLAPGRFDRRGGESPYI